MRHHLDKLVRKSSQLRPFTMMGRSALALLASFLFAQAAATNPTMSAPSGDSCSPIGTPCVSSCVGKVNGDYQSCHGCDVYVTCDADDIVDDRPCPEGLSWDDTTKTCEWESTTCSACPDVDYSCDYVFDLRNNDLGTAQATDVIHWSKLPEPAGADPTCSSQGVLRFELRNHTCATGLRFVMKFNSANVRNFSFAIGDSVQNDGWGGGGSVDSEMHNFNREVFLFDRTVGYNNAIRIDAVDYVRNVMLVTLKLTGEMKEVFMTNFADPGPSVTSQSGGLYTPTLMYLGVNRVLRHFSSEVVEGRVGSGLCSACVKILCDPSQL